MTRARARVLFRVLATLALISAAVTTGTSAEEPPGGSSTPSELTPLTEYERTYLELFGHVPSREFYELTATLRLDGRDVAELPVEIALHGSEVRLPADATLETLEETLLEDALAAVSLRVGLDGELSSLELDALGYETRFDSRRLILSITTPISARRVSILSLRGSSSPRSTRSGLEPARISGFLNTSTRGQLLDEQTSLEQELDALLNVEGWVARTSTSYRSARGHSFQVTHGSIHRDDHERALRYEAGSLHDAGLDPEATEQLLGLQVISISALPFYERPSPDLREVLELEDPSSVEIWINGVRRRRYALQPGRYELRDFPLADGLNRVEIRASVEGDEILLRERDRVWDNDMLNAGEAQVSAAAGVPADLDGRLRPLRHAFPLLSGLYRVGATERLSFGTYLRGNHRRQSGGFSTIVATSIGSLTAAGGFSHRGDDPLQGAGLLRLRNFSGDRRRVGLASYGLNLRAESSRFGQRFKQSFTRGRILGSSGFLGFRLGGDHSGQLRTHYDVNRAPLRNSYGSGLSFFHRFDRGLRVTLAGDWQRDTLGRSVWLASLRVSFYTPTHRSRATLQVDVPDPVGFLELSKRGNALDDMRARFRYHEPSDFEAQAEIQRGDWRGGLGGLRSFARDELAARIDYSGPRGFLRGHYARAIHSRVAAAPDRAFLSADAALAYADGHFALSRPVRDSFLILRPNPRIKRSRIRYTSQAESDWLGPAVASNLRPLQHNTIRVIDSDLPAGAWIPQRTHSLRPLPDTGYIVTVGEGGGLLVEGVLVNVAGTPFSLSGGRIRSFDDPDWPRQDFFTNREGAFTLIDMPPGSYRIRLSGEERPEALLEIPEDADEFFDVGVLVLTASRLENDSDGAPAPPETEP